MFVDVFVPSETKGSTTGDSVKFNCLAINIYNTWHNTIYCWNWSSITSWE